MANHSVTWPFAPTTSHPTWQQHQIPSRSMPYAHPSAVSPGTHVPQFPIQQFGREYPNHTTGDEQAFVNTQNPSGFQRHGHHVTQPGPNERLVPGSPQSFYAAQQRQLYAYTSPTTTQPAYIAGWYHDSMSYVGMQDGPHPPRSEPR